MFPFAVRKSFVISNHIDKVQFAESLVNKLLRKLHKPNVAIIQNGYEIVFNRGFTEVLIRLNWISGGLIRVTFSGNQLRVTYELSFVHMFWLACFLTSIILISIIADQFSLRPGSSATQLWGIGILWSLYTALVYITTVIFDLRMGKTINEVELSRENISQEQLSWMSRPDVCPACGAAIEKHMQVCPDCGLTL
ncbi:hypothetical protein Q0590_06190 [Rhodocytophaga aerolata]|uniref:Zinc ribbon domain-containing protein n=1 Tax=Rhodocytophaga aerolata TaxID=455078 RepID=A0ABT8R162_9BACT|nr:hypothetical protein [Rhodocytophaga aerolata]MDO1445831.1 hypothetical protein [Rhodocytophaga aerolata]